MINKRIKYIMFIILIIRTIYCIYLYNFKYSEWKNKIIDVKVENIEKITEDTVTYKIKYNRDTFLLNIRDTSYLYKYGDKIRILTSNYKIEKLGNPYEYDYKKYLNSKGIISNIYCIKIIKKIESNKDIFSPIYYIRDKMSEKLDKYMGTQNSNLLKSLLYGDDTLLDDKLKNKFSDIGMGHILCVSGTHVLFLLSSFDLILQDKKHKFLKVILLGYFYIISLFNVSLLRAICMFLCGLFKKKVTFKEKYIFTLLVILICNPYNIFNIGVIFSFLSILSIHLFNSLVSSWINIKLKIYNKFLVNNISLTISSQILLLPFLIYYFQSISLISIISNLFISVTLNIVLISGFSLFILFFIPILSNILIYICNIAISILIFQVNLIYKINYFNIKLPKPNVVIVIMYYFLVIVYLYGNKISIISWKNRKIIAKTEKIICYICVIYFFVWYIFTMYFESYVIFFNVGQGNMALLHNHTTNIIIDIGSTNQNIAGNIMLNFLKAKNINNIDAILITHMHSDHMNGVEEIIKNIKVKAIGYSLPVENSKEYEELLKLIDNSNVSKLILNGEDCLNINGIIIDVLSPPKKYVIKDEDMLNANSTIYLIENKDKNYLFMGDATKETEKYILDKYIYNKMDNNEKVSNKIKKLVTYQVGHHGSKTSTYEPFISNISSCNAIVSSKKSVYGHPNEEVLNLLSKYKFKILITEKLGAIKF